MTSNKIAALGQRIAKLNARLAEFDNLLDEEAGAMSDEQIATVTAERDGVRRTVAALQSALTAEQSKSLLAIEHALKDARKTAEKACRDAALDRAQVAAKIDAAIAGLIAGIQQYDALNATMRMEAFNAGLSDGNTRSYNTDLRPVSAVLADALCRSGLSAKLDFVAVHGTQHTDGKASIADLTAKTNAKLLAAVGNISK